MFALVLGLRMLSGVFAPAALAPRGFKGKQCSHEAKDDS
jgi:hypothetical protein